MYDKFKAKLLAKTEGAGTTIEVDGDLAAILHTWLALTMQIEEQTNVNMAALAAKMLPQYKDCKKVTVDLGKISEAQKRMHGDE